MESAFIYEHINRSADADSARLIARTHTRHGSGRANEKPMIGGGSDADIARVRILIAEVDRAMYALQETARDRGGGSVGATAWAELVKLLALGVAPALRACPVCKHAGMRAATRCGFCWSKLSPLPPESEKAANS